MTPLLRLYWPMPEVLNGTLGRASCSGSTVKLRDRTKLTDHARLRLGFSVSGFGRLILRAMTLLQKSCPRSEVPVNGVFGNLFLPGPSAWFLGSEESPLSSPLLVVVVSWLTAIFISFGLFAH